MRSTCDCQGVSDCPAGRHAAKLKLVPSPLVKVIYVEHGGARHEHDLPAGWNAMDGAVQYDIRAIRAHCGGAGVCATCHVYVDEAFAAQLPEPTRDESATLNFTACDRQPNSRLACRIELSESLDGIVLRIPERQL